MRIFKQNWFTKFAGKEGISDTELKDIVERLENGLFYANLGGGVYKEKAGKNNYRVVVLFKMGDKTFFEYGFVKAGMENIQNYRGLTMKKYQDEMAMVIHQGAEALYNIGAINDDQMREFDSDCLAAKPTQNQKQNAASYPSNASVYVKGQ